CSRGLAWLARCSSWVRTSDVGTDSSIAAARAEGVSAAVVASASDAASRDTGRRGAGRDDVRETERRLAFISHLKVIFMLRTAAERWAELSLTHGQRLRPTCYFACCRTAIRWRA